MRGRNICGATIVALVSIAMLSGCSPAFRLANDATDGDVAAVKADLASGTPVDAADDDDGQTALGYAAANGQLDAVKLLLASGAKVDAHDKSGWTPLMMAASETNKDADYLDVVSALIAAGADVAATDTGGLTPLMHAAMLGDPRIVPVLVRAGADVNRIGGANSALGLAAHRGDIAMMQALLDAGANLNGGEMDNGTPLPAPLNEAAMEGHAAAVAFLIKAGADINGRGLLGTPLQMAAFFGKSDVVRVLLDGGADPNIKDTDGETALKRAQDRHYDDIVTMITQHGGHA